MRMSRNLPDAITFNSALCACAGSWTAAYHLYGLMLREEMLNEVPALVQGCRAPHGWTKSVRDLIPPRIPTNSGFNRGFVRGAGLVHPHELFLLGRKMKNVWRGGGHVLRGSKITYLPAMILFCAQREISMGNCSGFSQTPYALYTSAGAEVGGNTAISCAARWPASLALAQQMSCRQVRQNAVTIGGLVGNSKA